MSKTKRFKVRGSLTGLGAVLIDNGLPADLILPNFPVNNANECKIHPPAIIQALSGYSNPANDDRMIMASYTPGPEGETSVKTPLERV